MPAKSDPLAQYRRKRDFKRTPEPAGERRKASRFPRFVVQKHAATRLHYDFRLEVGGVLKSWAVPKGPSLDPKARRLAIPTEDHPMEYAGFEGFIPLGEYGGGAVIVWDRGFYVNVTQKNSKPLPMEAALRRGHAKFWLEGEKLKGGFTLTRMGRAGGKLSWILVKLSDPLAGSQRDLVAKKPRSVLSGRTIEAVSKERVKAIKKN